MILDEYILIAPEGHRLHDPSVQIDDGIPVPVLDVPSRSDVLSSSAGRLMKLVGADALNKQDIYRIHDEELVQFLATAYERWQREGRPGPVIPDTFGPRSGIPRLRTGTTVRADAAFYCRDTCSPIVAGTWAAACSAFAQALTAARRICDGTRIAYVPCRPPGHHAGRSEISGFCYLNNAAGAAAFLRRAGHVAILDIDFHHGNGTQQIFWNDPRVLYCSIHGDPRHHFPFFCGFEDEVGGNDAPGANANIILADGASGSDYLAALQSVLFKIGTFAPSYLIVSLGFDICASDHVGSFDISDNALHLIGREIGALSLRTVIVQEGGYDVVHLGDQVTEFLSGILGN